MVKKYYTAKTISIHVPLAGDDVTSHLSITKKAIFLSTSPLRGTTTLTDDAKAAILISIHVPLAGDDVTSHLSITKKAIFLSTSPLRGTTNKPLSQAAVPQLFLSTSPLRGTTNPA